MMHDIFHSRLARALKRSGDIYALSDILAALDTGDMQSFTRNNTWVITQVCQYPRRKVLDILYLIGELADAQLLEPEVTEFARGAGVTLIRAYGRDGWATFTDKYGWHSLGRVYHKELSA
jgi:hypothetical protein